MKQALLILITLWALSFGPLPAQPGLLSVPPAPVEESFKVDLADAESLVELYARIENRSGDTLRLRWQRYEMEAPEAWQVQVCDPNMCYLPDVESNYEAGLNPEEPVVVPPGSAFTLTLYLLPNGSAGKGVYDIDLSTVEDPGNVLETVVFRTEVQDTPPIRRRLSPPSEPLRIFPNPTTDYFELNRNGEVDVIEVYNVLGSRVRRFNVGEGKRYYLNGLPDGMYLVSLVSHESGILTTLRLSKRAFQP
jgi:hypothetical protein